jgi:hypothetical protein
MVHNRELQVVFVPRQTGFSDIRFEDYLGQKVTWLIIRIKGVSSFSLDAKLVFTIEILSDIL